MSPYPYHLSYSPYDLPLPYPEHRTPQHRANRYEAAFSKIVWIGQIFDSNQILVRFDQTTR
jgi:hypothetical protein